MRTHFETETKATLEMAHCEVAQIKFHSYGNLRYGRKCPYESIVSVTWFVHKTAYKLSHTQSMVISCSLAMNIHAMIQLMVISCPY